MRALVSVAAMIAFAWGAWAAGRIAVARLLVKYGITVADTSALDRAIALEPADAETHHARAAVANYLGQPAEALKELEPAVSLRPRYYFLWLQLGMARDELGDTNGALSAFNESVRLAPYYAQPRWQRGNLLFRMARYDEAFADLRNAATSDPELLPGFIDLAWGASLRDPKLTEQIVEPRTNNVQLAMARFFATHGKPAEAVAHFKLAHNNDDQVRSELLRQLMTAAAFRQAFDLWSTGDPPQNNTDQLKETIYDGGFENPLSVDESGFGWRAVRGEPGLSLSLDASEPHSGARSLRVDFNGSSNPGRQIVSQLIPIEPATRYKLSFAARSQTIVTGGPPLIAITDATGEHRQLGRSVSLPQGTSGWRQYSFEFMTEAATGAVVISLQREDCTSSPCPIFGSLNLDSFSLERVK